MSIFVFPSTGETWTYRNESPEGDAMLIKGLEHQSCKEKMQKLGLFNCVYLIIVHEYLLEAAKKMEPDSSQWCPGKGQQCAN